MTATGYHRTIHQSGASWRREAERQAGGPALAAGAASGRAHAAVEPARVIAFGVVADQAAG